VYQNSRRPSNRPKKQKTPKWPFVLLAVFAVCLLLGSAYMVFRNVKKIVPNGEQTSEQTLSFDKQQFSLTDPTSPWLVVNKQHPLNPLAYAPSDLRTPDMSTETDQRVNDRTATALEVMAAAAKKKRLTLTLASGYRSYSQQTSIYNNMVRAYGQAEADRQSARPGHSEHQTGWAADLGAGSGKCRIEACFANTPEGKWLAANAYKYGFIIRYAEGKESVTGYEYEPWHVRYVGTDLAIEMYRTGIKTLEEFFDLPAASNY